MSNDLDPIIGNWYHDPADDTDFQVISLDEDEGLIEIEYADGDLDEIDMEQWQEMELEQIDNPLDLDELLDTDYENLDQNDDDSSLNEDSYEDDHG